MKLKVAPYDYAWTLKSVPLSGGRPHVIGPSFVPGPEMTGTFDLGISKSANRVAFLAGKLNSPELYISDFDGAHLTKPNIVLPDDKFSIPIPTGTTRPPNGYGNLTVPDPGNIIVLRAWKERPELKAYDRYDYLISIDGTQISRLPLASGTLYDLPQMSELLFTRDALVGTQILENGQLEAVSISTDNAQVNSLCAGVTGTAVKILADQNRLFVASQDSQKQILNIFENLSAASCIKRNSIPLLGSNILAMSLSPDGRKLLVTTSIANQNLIHYQLIYVPLDGQPPLLINTPVYFGAWIWGAFFSKDSSSIVYYGDQIKPGESGVFLWHTPKQ